MIFLSLSSPVTTPSTSNRPPPPPCAGERNCVGRGAWGMGRGACGLRNGAWSWLHRYQRPYRKSCDRKELVFPAFTPCHSGAEHGPPQPAPPPLVLRRR